MPYDRPLPVRIGRSDVIADYASYQAQTGFTAASTFASDAVNAALRAGGGDFLRVNQSNWLAAMQAAPFNYPLADIQAGLAVADLALKALSPSAYAAIHRPPPSTTVTQPGAAVTPGVSPVLPPAAGLPWYRQVPTWAWVAGGSAAAIGAVALFLRRKR